jgi:hypothetical protein
MALWYGHLKMLALMRFWRLYSICPPAPSFFLGGGGGGGCEGSIKKKMKIACSVGVGARKSLRRRGRGGRGRYRGVYENPLCDMFSPSPYKVLERSGS